MSKRVIVGLPGRLTAQAMISAAAQAGGMFVKPTDLGGSAVSPILHRAPDKPVTSPIGKLQKTRGRL